MAQMYPINGSQCLLNQRKQKADVWGSLIVNVYHQVSAVLNLRAEKWLAGSRVFRYDSVLEKKMNPSFPTDRSLNPERKERSNLNQLQTHLQSGTNVWRIWAQWGLISSKA